VCRKIWQIHIFDLLFYSVTKNVCNTIYLCFILLFNINCTFSAVTGFSPPIFSAIKITRNDNYFAHNYCLFFSFVLCFWLDEPDLNSNLACNFFKFFNLIFKEYENDHDIKQHIYGEHKNAKIWKCIFLLCREDLGRVCSIIFPKLKRYIQWDLFGFSTLYNDRF
jgi:hypothetical protein